MTICFILNYLTENLNGLNIWSHAPETSTNYDQQALTWNPQGRRKTGHPKNRWQSDLQTDTEMTGYTWR